jgi:hypothetical protein
MVIRFKLEPIFATAQLLQKIEHDSKVGKIDAKVIISLSWSKSVKLIVSTKDHLTETLLFSFFVSNYQMSLQNH